jgi:hypothetical protein
MFARAPKHTVESLKAIIASLEARGKNAETWRVKLRELRNAELVAGLKAAKLRARVKETAA